jgi:hypothetical protein
MNPIGDPMDWDRQQRYAEASRPHALLVTDRGVTRAVAEDVWLDRVDVAIELARSMQSLFICVVVAERSIVDAMQAQDLDLSSPAGTVSKLASVLAERRGWARAVFAVSSAELVRALDIDRDGRPLLRVGPRQRRAEPDVVVSVRRRLVPGRPRRGSR